ncbi:AbrB/MazE/SpoVT family DNA-binding domain-containing protein [Mesorhizobium qingshengii]|uniref:AbrB/MazE/SpoVT family DNA-binding domain-containing protein n=1 Tax=Mesorhizobium qingshengii TaxID=1165689 RepID=A0ABT4QNL2_9HYPH|nr:AbrB/MazE/SpoVT family DNA-binding domain-containing protein [Mesorhizobium qingshengii]MCZ8543147.1 AbrB/MazE/SpoVT family DNA-binding domain-containing protein [Mesorhizobium qingshengii]
MKTTIRKIGDSEGVIVPRELLDRMNLRVGDQLQIVETDDGIVLRPATDSFDRQMKAARDVMDKYKAGLQKLAE